jgi:hypothetical protein
VVNANPAGTTYILKTGTHRQQTVMPKSGDKFYGETETVLEGSSVIAGWTASGGRWFHDQAHSSPTSYGEGDAACWLTIHPRCGEDRELFRNHVRQKHEASVGAVGAGEWYFDRGAGRMWVGSEPKGQTITYSDTPQSFTGTNDDVLLQGFTIREYSSPSQAGCFNVEGALRWTIKRLTVTNCHGMGVRVGTFMLIEDSYITYNGQLGIGGGGSNITVQYVEVAYNNAAGYNPGWEAGGSKFAYCNTCKVAYSYFHDNLGPGIWYDIDNTNFTVEYNTSDDNYTIYDLDPSKDAHAPGIMIEISYGGVVR